VHGFGELHAGMMCGENVLLLREVISPGLQPLAQGVTQAGFVVINALLRLLQQTVRRMQQRAFGGELDHVLMMLQQRAYAGFQRAGDAVEMPL